jgi:hypothetical protein
VNKSKKLDMSLDQLSYMPNLFFPFGGFGQDFYENLTLMAQLDTEYRQLLNTTGIDTLKLLHQITFSCEQILDHCYFGYGTFIDGNTCCLLFFGDPEYGMAGKCFRTNNRNLNFTLKESSAQSGLVVKLTTKKYVINSLNYNILNYPASLFDGVSFAATNRQNHLYAVVPKIKSLVPNAFNAISLKKITLDRSRKQSPFGPYLCVGDDDLDTYAHLTPDNVTYTREHCIISQKQKSVVNTYNCSLIYFTAIPDTDYCGPTETTNIYFER